jgi:hypothetical protein
VALTPSARTDERNSCKVVMLQSGYRTTLGTTLSLLVSIDRKGQLCGCHTQYARRKIVSSVPWKRYRVVIVLRSTVPPGTLEIRDDHRVVIGPRQEGHCGLSSLVTGNKHGNLNYSLKFPFLKSEWERFKLPNISGVIKDRVSYKEKPRFLKFDYILPFSWSKLLHPSYSNFPSEWHRNFSQLSPPFLS